MTLALDMFPMVAYEDSPDGCLPNSVLRGERSLRDTPCAIFHADLAHLGCGQFGTLDLFSFGLPPLADLVVSIAAWGSGEQMAEPDAGWIVTVMENVRSSRISALLEFPPDTVRLLGAPARDTDPSVPVIVSRSCPDPARPKFGADDRPVLVDLLPEALSQRPDGSICDQGGLGAWPTAVVAVTHPDSKRPSPEFGTTSLTDAGDGVVRLLAARLNTHREPQSLGVTPPDGRTSRGLLHFSLYHGGGASSH